METADLLIKFSEANLELTNFNFKEDKPALILQKFLDIEKEVRS